MERNYLDYGIRRKSEIKDPNIAEKYLQKISENPDEITVLVNHANNLNSK